MIKIKVEYNSNFISSFKISGHANYDDYGKDIVCASVSSIAISSVNLALKLVENSVSFDSKEGLLYVTILKQDEVINKVFLNMIDMFKELEKQYKNNIKII